MNKAHHYFFETIGYEFETGMVDVVSSFAKKEWGIGAVKFNAVRQDHYESTDMFVLGIPIDVTLAFEKKSKTRRLGSLMLDGVTIEYGVRFGNSKAAFNVPVLVIGAATAIGITKSNVWHVMNTIKSYLHEILDTSMDHYLLATQA